MIISVMSQDRPGIIADITGAIHEFDGDLADLNQSILHGYLTMILIASFQRNVTAKDILARISQISSPTRLNVSVREMSEPIQKINQAPEDKIYIVTAQGDNKRGIVHGISSFCYHHNINILDLATTRAAGKYTMILQLDLSKAGPVTNIQHELMTYGSSRGLSIVMQHQDLFKVTNEITF